MDFRALLILFPAFLLIMAPQDRQIEPDPPEGFRAIARSEYSDSWLELIERNPEWYSTPDKVTGDFDGDEKDDLVRLWIRTEGYGWVVMAYITSQPDEPIQLTQANSRPYWRHALRAVPPGTHKTHRYYGIGPGGPDSTAVIKTTTYSISLGMIGSEGVTFIWDLEKRVFKEVYMY